MRASTVPKTTVSEEQKNLSKVPKGSSRQAQDSADEEVMRAEMSNTSNNTLRDIGRTVIMDVQRGMLRSTRCGMLK